MEGVPRIPMYSVDMKCSVTPIDFTEPVLNYIAEKYDESPGDYRQALEELNKLREKVIQLVPSNESIDSIKRYYVQLVNLKNRVPMEHNDSSAITFFWIDKNFDMPAPTSWDDVNFELASLMHNMGALYSQMGAVEARVSLESIKLAFNAFQQASYCFQHIRDKMGASHFSVDFDETTLTFLCNLMIAQAQECVIEKSLIDHRKSTIVAKISQQAANMYKKIAETAPDNADDTITSNLAVIKYYYYSALARACMGQDAADRDEYGERVAWWRASAAELNNCVKASEKEKHAASMKETLQFTRDFIAKSFEIAQKENNMIYHAKIPAQDTLKEIDGIVLAKPIVLNLTDKEVVGEDLFRTLVPLTVSKTSSIYSEKKDQYLRKIKEKVCDANQQLDDFMVEYEVDSLLLNESTTLEALPQDLLKASATFLSQPDALPQLFDDMQRLTTCYQEADRMLNDINDRLRDLQQEKCELKDIQAEKNSIVNIYKSYCQAHQMATERNSELQKSIAQHSLNIQTLSTPINDIVMSLPSISTLAAEGDEEIKELKKISEKVAEMRAQREKLLNELVQKVQADDLTSTLLAEKDLDETELFDKELAKFDDTKKLLLTNLSAQTNIMTALYNSRNKAAMILEKRENVHKEREAMIADLLESHRCYEDASDRADDGRKFYSAFLAKLRLLDQRIDDFYTKLDDARKIENERRKETERAQLAFNSVSELCFTGTNTSFPNFDMAQRAQISPNAAPSIQANSSQRTGRPRLADYMDYYRSKQAEKMAGKITGTTQQQSMAQQICQMAPSMQMMTRPQQQYQTEYRQAAYFQSNMQMMQPIPSSTSIQPSYQAETNATYPLSIQQLPVSQSFLSTVNQQPMMRNTVPVSIQPVVQQFAMPLVKQQRPDNIQMNHATTQMQAHEIQAGNKGQIESSIASVMVSNQKTQPTMHKQSAQQTLTPTISFFQPVASTQLMTTNLRQPYESGHQPVLLHSQDANASFAQNSTVIPTTLNQHSTQQSHLSMKQAMINNTNVPAMKPAPNQIGPVRPDALNTSIPTPLQSMPRNQDQFMIGHNLTSQPSLSIAQQPYLSTQQRFNGQPTPAQPQIAIVSTNISTVQKATSVNNSVTTVAAKSVQKPTATVLPSPTIPRTQNSATFSSATVVNQIAMPTTTQQISGGWKDALFDSIINDAPSIKDSPWQVNYGSSIDVTTNTKSPWHINPMQASIELNAASPAPPAKMNLIDADDFGGNLPAPLIPTKCDHL